MVKSLFQSANCVVEMIESGVDLQSHAKGSECGPWFTQLHQALAQSGGRAKVMWVQVQGFFTIFDGPGKLISLKKPDGPLIIGFREGRRFLNELIDFRARSDGIGIARGLLQLAVLLGCAAPKPNFPKSVRGEHLHERIGIVKGGRDVWIGLHGPDKAQSQDRSAACFHVVGKKKTLQGALGIALQNSGPKFPHRILYSRRPQLFIIPGMKRWQSIVHFDK